MKQITVYSRQSCAPCKILKQWLDYKGVSYDVLDIDENPDNQKKAFELSGASIVPVTHVTDDTNESVIVGWNLDKLIPALQ